MSEFNCIKVLLGIQDNFLDIVSPVREELRRGRKCQVLDAVLTHSPDSCPHCGCVAEDFNIIKNGSFRSEVRIPKASKGYEVVIILKKNRFLCKSCNTTFQLPNSIVEPHCSISNATKSRIAHDATFKTSETEIAYHNHVSHSTVNRILNKVTEESFTVKNYLPDVLCFDEFKSTKHADGAMSFIFMDPEAKTILDIVEDRKLGNLISYFRRTYTRGALESVKYIVIDMYEPYVQLINTCFPNAEIVCDKFHIVQHINRALNSARIEAMKKHKEHQAKFKKFWKLILMDSVKLNRTRNIYCHSFKAWKSSAQIVEFLLDLDEELRATYHYYQKLLLAIQTKNEELMTDLLMSKPEGISDKMNTARNSLLKFLEPVLAALRTSYSNGVLEGTNNLIKVIKRIAFGYRCFYHFRSRVLLIHNHNPIKLHRKKIV